MTFFLHREGSNEWLSNYPVFNDKVIATEKYFTQQTLTKPQIFLSILQYLLISGKMFNDSVNPWKYWPVLKKQELFLADLGGGLGMTKYQQCFFPEQST